MSWLDIEISLSCKHLAITNYLQLQQRNCSPLDKRHQLLKIVVNLEDRKFSDFQLKRCLICNILIIYLQVLDKIP